MKCSVNFFQGPIGLIVVVGVHVVGLISHLQADVVDLVPYALELPDEVDPGVSGERIARDIGLPPKPGFIIPDVPCWRSVSFEVALRSPNPAVSAKGLVEIKLQRLRGAWIIDVEVQVIGEMTNVIAAGNG